MKLKYLLENDLITIDQIPLHIQDIGEVFARVKSTFGDDWVYIVKQDDIWKPFYIDDAIGVTEYLNVVNNFENEPKKLLCNVAKNFKNYTIEYIVN